MIENILLTLLTFSIPAGIFIAVVAVMHKLAVPHRVFVILWVILGIRLLIPVHLESPFSIQGLIGTSENTRIQQITSGNTYNMTDPTPVNLIPDKENGNTVSPAPAYVPITKDQTTTAVRPVHIFQIAGWIWLCGMCLVLAWGIKEYIRLRLRLLDAVHLKENIWQSSRITSPFLFGMIRPGIYIPFGMEEDVLEYVLLHEKTHIKNKDHFIKLMWYALTAVYWFHPLVWAAYFLLGRDIELACDEQVIRKMDTHGKTDYANALLEVSTNRKLISSCPVAFGEVGVKMRIKNILNYKKPAFYATLLCIAACTALIIMLLTDPAENKLSAMDTQKQNKEQEETSQPAQTDNTEVPAPTASGSILDKVYFSDEYTVDLNKDGTPETVSAKITKDDGYDPMPELTISGKTFDSTYMRDTLSFYMADLDTSHYYFLDLDTSDSYVEIAFFDFGPSDDPVTYVLRYVDDGLVLLGSFTSEPENPNTTIPGDGTVTATTRCDIIQTDWTIGTWKLTGEKLELQELTEGEFLAWQERYGSDYPVTAKQDFHAFYADPMSSAVASVKKGTEVAIQSFKKSEDNNTITIYFYYKDENGEEQHARFDMKEDDPYTVFVLTEHDGAWEQQEIPSIELFDGLGFAG